tara:strand:- start:1453 stop:1566 length:114 start_codon:yes stop_codon:yes gene_type:complete
MWSWFWNLIDKCVERSLQKQAEKLFEREIRRHKNEKD